MHGPASFFPPCAHALLLAFFAATCYAGGEEDQRDYINKWKDEAVRQMALHRIPASITLAQGLLESGSGKSELSGKSNNHFGIKCHKDWEGGRTYYDDDAKGECFRVYDDPRDSFEDHSLFLLRKRYASLFELKIDDYKGWARGLKRCGYATSPTYAKALIELVDRHGLDQYDKEGWAGSSAGKCRSATAGLAWTRPQRTGSSKGNEWRGAPQNDTDGCRAATADSPKTTWLGCRSRQGRRWKPGESTRYGRVASSGNTTTWKTPMGKPGSTRTACSLPSPKGGGVSAIGTWPRRARL